MIGRALDIMIIDHIVVTSNHAHHILKSDRVARQSPEQNSFLFRSRERRSSAKQAAALENARATMRKRLLRRQLIGAEELFGEPAWEMLIDLFIHECLRKPLSTSDLCVTSSLPMSSALRLIQRLCDAELIERISDPMDARRSFVRLRGETSHRLLAYFETGPE